MHDVTGPPAATPLPEPPTPTIAPARPHRGGAFIALSPLWVVILASLALLIAWQVQRIQDHLASHAALHTTPGDSQMPGPGAPGMPDAAGGPGPGQAGPGPGQPGPPPQMPGPGPGMPGPNGQGAPDPAGVMTGMPGQPGPAGVMTGVPGQPGPAGATTPAGP